MRAKTRIALILMSLFTGLAACELPPELENTSVIEVRTTLRGTQGRPVRLGAADRVGLCIRFLNALELSLERNWTPEVIEEANRRHAACYPVRTAANGEVLLTLEGKDLNLLANETPNFVDVRVYLSGPRFPGRAVKGRVKSAKIVQDMLHPGPQDFDIRLEFDPIPGPSSN